MATVNVYGGDVNDAFISQLQPDTNFEVGDRNIEVGWYIDKFEERGLLRADLSAYVPVGSTNLTATFYAYLEGHDYHADSAYTGFRIRTENRAWVHDEVTWNIYKTGSNWETAGCSDGTLDFDIDVSFGPWNPPEGVEAWTSVDCTTFVQDAWANRGKIFDCRLSNAFFPDPEESARIVFKGGAHENRWYIAVTYDPPTGALVGKISGVPWASTKKVSEVAEASIKKVSEVSAN